MYHCLPDKTLHLKGEKCSGGSIEKWVSPDWLLGMPMERDLPCSLLGSVKTLGVLKALNICRVDTELNLKAGCPQNYLKNGYGSLSESLV